MQEKIVIIYFYASLNSDAESNLNFLINISVIVFVLNIYTFVFVVNLIDFVRVIICIIELELSDCMKENEIDIHTAQRQSVICNNKKKKKRENLGKSNRDKSRKRNAR